MDLLINFPYYSALISGSLILEMGSLSRLTGDPRYEAAALRALRKLWSMRSSLNLMGTTLDVATGDWIEYSGGIGAGRFPIRQYCDDLSYRLSQIWIELIVAKFLILCRG